MTRKNATLQVIRNGKNKKMKETMRKMEEMLKILLELSEPKALSENSKKEIQRRAEILGLRVIKSGRKPEHFMSGKPFNSKQRPPLSVWLRSAFDK